MVRYVTVRSAIQIKSPPDSLAEIRQRCDRMTIICYVRTSGNCAMTPLSPETLQLLAGLGIELHLIASTRATVNSNDREPDM